MTSYAPEYFLFRRAGMTLGGAGRKINKPRLGTLASILMFLSPQTWSRVWGDNIQAVENLPDKEIPAENGRYIFGPVPSRRLGRSLGLDLIPSKTCTQDCLYCEVGRTDRLSIERFDPGRTETIIKQLARFLSENKTGPDYITLAGSGEPTLNIEIGRIIDRIKALTAIPVAVLTNGTLLYREEVRRDLSRADLVVPSLDAGREETFQKLNRPHPDLSLDLLVEGLLAFRAEFKGRFWLEVLLVAGINDLPEELEALRALIARIKPDRLQVNTVFRPPSFQSAKSLTPEALEKAAHYLGLEAEPVGRFKPRGESLTGGGLENDILAMLSRRPCTMEEVAESLARPLERVIEVIEALKKNGLIALKEHDRKKFYVRV